MDNIPRGEHMIIKKIWIGFLLFIIILSVVVVSVSLSNKDDAISTLKILKADRQSKIDYYYGNALISLYIQPKRECVLDYDTEKVEYCKLFYTFSYKNEIVNDYIEIPEIIPKEITTQNIIDKMINPKIKKYIESSIPKEDVLYLE